MKEADQLRDHLTALLRIYVPTDSDSELLEVISNARKVLEKYDRMREAGEH